MRDGVPHPFAPGALDALAEAYPLAGARVRHELAGHPLFALEALADAAPRLPAEAVEVRASENVHGGAFPLADAADVGGLIRGIGQARRWVLLRGLERLPDYRDAIAAVLDALERVVAPATGPLLKRRSFLFISSPGLLTPLHFDPEYNLFLQLGGRKSFAVLPATAPWIDEPRLDRFRASGDNLLACDPEVERVGAVHEVGPGDALYVPYCAPHWVRVGDAPSVSLSVTWTTGWANRHEDGQRLGAWLRRLGLPAPSPLPWPRSSGARALTGKLLARAGLAP